MGHLRGKLLAALRALWGEDPNAGPEGSLSIDREFEDYEFEAMGRAIDAAAAWEPPAEVIVVEEVARCECSHTNGSHASMPNEFGKLHCCIGHCPCEEWRESARPWDSAASRGSIKA